MKRLHTNIFAGLILLAIASIFSSYAQESQEESLPTESPATESDSEMTPDMKVIAKLLDGAEAYKTSYEDSVALQNKKKRQLRQKTAEIIAKNVGKPISFSSLEVWEVEPEKELTPYGYKKAQGVLKKLKQHPQTRDLINIMGGGDLKENPLLQLFVAAQLVTCKKCMRNTGRFEVTFKLADSAGYDQIIKVVDSEEAALRYVKGSRYPVSGRIAFLEVKDAAAIEVKIILK